MLITAAKASEAAEVLGVSLTGLTSEIVGKAYRGKAKTCHPDYHGSTELQTWARVSWAKEALERWLKVAPAKVDAPLPINACRACGGAGRVSLKPSGFSKPMTMMCVMCEGRGEVIEGSEDDVKKTVE